MSEHDEHTVTLTKHSRGIGVLGLERNTAAVAVAIFTMALGEQLWRRFLPKYLEALGAPLIAIGLYGSTQDLLDGVYQYPGGWLADRHGRRRALLLFICLAFIGYGVIAVATTWPIVLLGIVFMMAWSSMASPTLFAVVGDSLPRERRTMGFSIQSLVRRIPIAIAPTLGGLLIAGQGVRSGMKTGLIVSLVMALLTLVVVSQIRLALPSVHEAGVRGVWQSFPVPLRRLLVSDIFVRTCEGLVDVFLVLYALNVVGITAPQFGLLIAVQMTTSILGYIPAARLADRIGRKPLVIATFIAFSLFPVAVTMAQTFSGLLGAFVIGGLREIGEPARKALILDLVPDGARARGVGLYYLIRSLAITPAAVTGGVLWKVAPQVPFLVAGAIGLIGTAVFAGTVEERYAA
jgi:MFS family permease